MIGESGQSILEKFCNPHILRRWCFSILTQDGDPSGIARTVKSHYRRPLVTEYSADIFRTRGLPHLSRRLPLEIFQLFSSSSGPCFIIGIQRCFHRHSTCNILGSSVSRLWLHIPNVSNPRREVRSIWENLVKSCLWTNSGNQSRLRCIPLSHDPIADHIK